MMQSRSATPAYIEEIFKNNWPKVKKGKTTWINVLNCKKIALTYLDTLEKMQRRKQWQEAVVHAPIAKAFGVSQDRRRKNYHVD